MAIALLKKLNGMLPDSVKLLCAPIIRGGLIRNSVFLEQLQKLELMDTLNEEEIKLIQAEELRKIIIHAYENTAYYKKVFDEIEFDPYKSMYPQDIKKIPLLTKACIEENFDDLQAENVKDYYVATTGGSTGRALTVLLDKESIYKEKAFIYNFWKSKGYDYTTSKIATFRGVDFNGKIYKVNPLYNEIQLNPCMLNALTVRSYLKRIDKFGATFIHGYPSAIYAMCKYANQEKIDIRNKFYACFFISENVYEFQKEYIESSLECKTYAFYGHTERAVFAEETTDGYRFNEFYGFTEILVQEKENIVTTGFLNYKMPLVRYQIDDSAIKKNEKEYTIIGHWEGTIFGKQKEEISMATLNIHNKAFNHVAQYQFVQKEQGVLEIWVIPSLHFTDSDKKIIEKIFMEKFCGVLNVNVKIVQELILTSRGKYKLLVQEIKYEV